jgi:hypothetical protein
MNTPAVNRVVVAPIPPLALVAEIRFTVKGQVF